MTNKVTALILVLILVLILLFICFVMLHRLRIAQLQDHSVFSPAPGLTCLYMHRPSATDLTSETNSSASTLYASYYYGNM